MHCKNLSEKENFCDFFNSLDSYKLPVTKRQPSASLSQIATFSSLHNKVLRPKPADKNNSFHSTTARFQQTKPAQKIEHKIVRQKVTSSPLNRKYKTSMTNESLVLSSSFAVLPVQETEQERFAKIYSSDILGHLEGQQCIPARFLQSHQISHSLRAKMIDWMVEVLTSYKCRDQTLFLAIQIMDQYLSKSVKCHQPSDLHLLGVAAMFIACKYEEIYPVKLKVVHEKIAHKKIPIEDIKNKEADILNTLQFQIVFVTLYEVLTHLHMRLVTHVKVPKKVDSYILKAIIYIGKMIQYDYEMVQNQDNLIRLSGAILTVALKLVEKHDQSIKLNELMEYTAQLCKVSLTEMMDEGAQVLKMVKSFEKTFPNLDNLKKFGKFSFDEF